MSKRNEQLRMRLRQQAIEVEGGKELDRIEYRIGGAFRNLSLLTTFLRLIRLVLVNSYEDADFQEFESTNF